MVAVGLQITHNFALSLASYICISKPNSTLLTLCICIYGKLVNTG
jgi:hypothetical protein